MEGHTVRSTLLACVCFCSKLSLANLLLYHLLPVYLGPLPLEDASPTNRVGGCATGFEDRQMGL